MYSELFLIIGVQEGAAARGCGLCGDDVILEIDNIPVTNQPQSDAARLAGVCVRDVSSYLYFWSMLVGSS